MSIYYRVFFKCRTCGYKLNNLTQATAVLEGPCPACEDNNLDYMTKKDRQEYAKDLLDELTYMLEEGDIE